MARAKASFWTKSLDKLRGALLHAEPEPTPGPSKKKAAQKKSEQKKPEQPARSAAPAAKSPAAVTPDPAGAVPPQDEKNPKKKLPAQPWYRHRQRW
jgi:hypothetical protein